MPRIRFTQNIQRHVACPERDVTGSSLGEILEAYFSGEDGGDSWETVSTNLPPVYAVRFEKAA